MVLLAGGIMFGAGLLLAGFAKSDRYADLGIRYYIRSGTRLCLWLYHQQFRELFARIKED